MHKFHNDSISFLDYFYANSQTTNNFQRGLNASKVLTKLIEIVLDKILFHLGLLEIR